MLTAKGKYGLKALIDLAGLEKGALAQSADIARRNAISKKFLDAILADLRRAGIVETKKGKAGGYRLAKPAASVSLGSVIRVLDGPLAPIACASRNYFSPCEDCPDVERCAIRKVMLEVRDSIALVLERKSLAELQASAEILGDFSLHAV